MQSNISITTCYEESYVFKSLAKYNDFMLASFHSIAKAQPFDNQERDFAEVKMTFLAWCED
jgi:hypothetical protein